MSTPNKVLSTLADANGYVSLAIQVGDLLVPLAKGVISKIKSVADGAEVVQFQVLLAADQAELDDITLLSADDLTAINAELAAHGIPPVPPYDPGTTSAKGPAADPAPGTGKL